MFLIASICSIIYAEKNNISGKNINDRSEYFKKLEKILLTGIVFDTLVSITALVVGILVIVGFLTGLPPAAAYVFISLSCFITLTWIAHVALSCGETLQITKDLIFCKKDVLISKV